MKTKHTGCVATSILLITCLLFTIFWTDFNISVKATPDVIYVPDDHEKIQWAINNASAGSTIFVSSGIYYERLTIDKQLTLRGENEESIIDGNFTGVVIRVNANNVSISGFTIQNSGLGFWDSGIHTHHSNYNNISHNTVINNGHGIWFEASSHNIFTYNNISNNQCGIGLSFSHNNTIENNNIFSSDECGIGLDYSSHNILTGNIALNNDYGIWLLNSSYNIIFHNGIINNTNQAKCFNSTNTWDNGYPSGGNYWSDYIDVDNSSGPYQNITGSDGIWDHPYIINANNTDRYPFTNLYDYIPPTIGIPLRTPSGDILPNQEVKISVNVTDNLTGVKNVTLYHTIDDGLNWNSIEMNYNLSTSFYEANIPGQEFGTTVKFKIEAFDNVGNNATRNGSEPYCVYTVVPEFPSTIIPLVVIVLTTFAIIVGKKRFPKNQG